MEGESGRLSSQGTALLPNKRGRGRGMSTGCRGHSLSRMHLAVDPLLLQAGDVAFPDDSSMVTTGRA